MIFFNEVDVKVMYLLTICRKQEPHLNLFFLLELFQYLYFFTKKKKIIIWKPAIATMQDPQSGPVR